MATSQPSFDDDRGEEDVEPMKRRSSVMAAQARRREFVALLSLAGLLAYCDRVNISVAIIDMSADHNWSLNERGQVLGSFFYGYLFSQIPGALLASKYGGKAVLTTAVALWSVCTVLTPLVATSMSLLLLCRVALGLFEGVFFPAAHHFLSGHVPASERSRATGIINTGNSLGTVIAFFVCPYLSSAGYGWQSSFYLFGTAGLVWAAVWAVVAVDAPVTPPPDPQEDTVAAGSAPVLLSVVSDHTTCSALGFLATADQCTLVRTMLTEPACLAIFFGHFANNVGGYIVLAWLPTFISRTWEIPMNHVTLSFVPYACTAVFVNIASWFADRLICAGRDVTFVRKLMSGTAFLGAGTLYLLFYFLPTSSLSLHQAVAIICIAMSLQTCNQSGYEACKLDVASPRVAGLLSSLSNTFATLSGVIGVPLASVVVSATGVWSTVFLLITVVYFCAVFVFITFGSARRILH